MRLERGRESVRLFGAPKGYRLIGERPDAPSVLVFESDAQTPAGKVKAVSPVPRAQWPRWAVWVADSAQPVDVGVGDTIARELGRAGEIFKLALQAVGLKCGCGDRQAEWNQKFPYG